MKLPDGSASEITAPPVIVASDTPDAKRIAAIVKGMGLPFAEMAFSELGGARAAAGDGIMIIGVGELTADKRKVIESFRASLRLGAALVFVSGDPTEAMPYYPLHAIDASAIRGLIISEAEKIELRRRLIETRGEIEPLKSSARELSSELSHDLRSPLNAIIGFAELLEMRSFGDLNEKQAEYVGFILSSARRLLELIAAFDEELR